MTELWGIPAAVGRQLERARRHLTVADEVGLALRAHRRQLGMSQRTYARARGLSRPLLARAEAGATNIPLRTAASLLEGTGFALIVAIAEDSPDPPLVDAPALVASAGHTAPPVDGWPAVARAESNPERARSLQRMTPDDWLWTELVARVRGGSRRFPAHHETRFVKGSPPLWWWMHEFFTNPSNPPLWYSGSHGEAAPRVIPGPPPTQALRPVTESDDDVA